MTEEESIACKASNCSEREYLELQKAITDYNRKSPSKQYTQQDYPPVKNKVEFNSTQNTKWLYATFKTTSTNALNDEEEPQYENSNWSEIENISNNQECRGIIFKSKSTINYGISFVKITIKLCLGGKSDFWLFLHGKGELSQPTSVIKISQHVNEEEEDYQSLPIITVSLGTYLPFKNSNNQLKFFRKEQLIPDKPDKIRDNKESPVITPTSLHIEVIDNGKETIKLSIEVNECTYINEIKGNFFIPTNDECNILFAGSGHKCKLNYFSYETDVHSNYERAKDPTENNCITF
jgi:hypothetical protein